MPDNDKAFNEFANWVASKPDPPPGSTDKDFFQEDKDNPNTEDVQFFQHAPDLGQWENEAAMFFANNCANKAATDAQVAQEAAEKTIEEQLLGRSNNNFFGDGA